MTICNLIESISAYGPVAWAFVAAFIMLGLSMIAYVYSGVRLNLAMRRYDERVRKNRIGLH